LASSTALVFYLMHLKISTVHFAPCRVAGLGDKQDFVGLVRFAVTVLGEYHRTVGGRISQGNDRVTHIASIPDESWQSGSLSWSGKRVKFLRL
jgi:hypothetical protein